MYADLFKSSFAIGNDNGSVKPLEHRVWNTSVYPPISVSALLDSSTAVPFSLGETCRKFQGLITFVKLKEYILPVHVVSSKST